MSSRPEASRRGPDAQGEQAADRQGQAEPGEPVIEPRVQRLLPHLRGARGRPLPDGVAVVHAYGLTGASRRRGAHGQSLAVRAVVGGLRLRPGGPGACRLRRLLHGHDAGAAGDLNVLRPRSSSDRPRARATSGSGAWAGRSHQESRRTGSVSESPGLDRLGSAGREAPHPSKTIPCGQLKHLPCSCDHRATCVLHDPVQSSIPRADHQAPGDHSQPDRSQGIEARQPERAPDTAVP